MCEAGVNIKVIQDALGHSDISTTLNIYADVTKEMKAEEFKGLDSYFKVLYWTSHTEREHTECCVFFFSLDKKRNARMGYLYVSLNAQIRNITLLHSSSTSNNNYPQYKAPLPDYAPIHGLSSLLS